MALWDQLESEGHKAYMAFCMYRSFSSTRSLERVRKEMGKTPGYINQLEHWSAKYGWVKRAQAYDLYLEEIERKAEIKERREMAKRHVKISMAFQQKVVEGLQKLIPADMGASELARFFEIAVKIERQSRGESTDDITVRQGQVKEDDERTRAIIEDEEATELACKLYERITMGEDHACRVRSVGK